MNVRAPVRSVNDSRGCTVAVDCAEVLTGPAAAELRRARSALRVAEEAVREVRVRIERAERLVAEGCP